jgi:polyisoprenoid-binding protein YceI
MTLAPGTYGLGPGDGTLTVRTGKTGAASKAGHNLLIDVTAWSATLDLGDEPGEAAMALTADARSLRVREGSGGMQALGEEEKASIEQSIDDDVLKGGAIEFRSTSVAPGPDGTLRVQGDLDLLGTRRPIAFDLALGGGERLTASARFRQTDFGIKPFSTLFGTLKVADQVEVALDARLPAARPRKVQGPT